MSKDDTILIDKKTPIKMTAGIAASIIVAVAVTVWQASRILNKMDAAETHAQRRADDMHTECLSLFSKSWQISDMVEYNHQARGLSSNGLLPDVSEVLRMSRRLDKPGTSN